MTEGRILARAGVLLTALVIATACSAPFSVRDTAVAEPTDSEGVSFSSPQNPPPFERVASAAEAPLSSVAAPPLSRAGRLVGRRICLDPGHDWIHTPGAVARDPGGNVLFYEQDLTLAVSYKLKPLLEAEGAEVCATRDEGGSLWLQPYDFNGNGTTNRPNDAPERTQPRIDYMNAFGAELMLSIHFNGFSDPNISGAEVYYSDTGEYSQSNREYARAVLAALVDQLVTSGYQPVKRGIHSDRYKVEYRDYVRAYGYDERCSDCLRLFTLGNNPMSRQFGTWRAGALVEVLFLTNSRDVAFLTRPDALDIVAQGLAQGILHFVGE